MYNRIETIGKIQPFSLPCFSEIFQNPLLHSIHLIQMASRKREKCYDEEVCYRFCDYLAGL